MRKTNLAIAMIMVMCALLVPTEAVFASSGASSGKETSSIEDSFAYVDINTITVPVMTETGVTQQFTFSVSLEVDEAQKDRIARFNPRLTDAYIQDLYGALAAGFGFMQGDIIDVIAVKQRLKSVTKTVLKPAELEAHDVLLKVVQQYRL